jgi:hypothetical protein
MSIGNYILIVIGIILAGIGGLMIFSKIIEIIRSIQKKEIYIERHSVLNNIIFFGITLLFLALGCFILYEGYPYSIRTICWIFKISGYIFLISTLIIYLSPFVSRASDKIDRKEFLIMVIVSVLIILLTTFYYNATKSINFYKKIIPILISNAPKTDTILSVDSTLNINWPAAIFNINKDTVEIGYGEKKKNTFTIDDDISFKLPQKYLTNKIENLHTVVFLDWQYNILGSNWYRQTIHPMGTSTDFEIKDKQYVCKMYIYDIDNKSFIRFKEFKGSLPTRIGRNIEKSARGSDPTGEIVNYLKANL